MAALNSQRPLVARPRMAACHTVASLIAGASALLPTTAYAHGDVTGIADVWQDYGVAIFLSLVVIVGAGVLIWVLLAPLPIEATDDLTPRPASSDLDKPRRINHEDGRAP